VSISSNFLYSAFQDGLPLFRATFVNGEYCKRTSHSALKVNYYVNCDLRLTCLDIKPVRFTFLYDW